MDDKFTNRIFRKIQNQFFNMNLPGLMMIPIILGFISIVFPHEIFGEKADPIFIPLGFFFWGCAGLPIIIREEMPFGDYLSQKIIKVFGFLFMLLCFSIGAIIIYGALTTN